MKTPNFYQAVESLRRAASILFATFFLGAALLSRPAGYDAGWREAAEHIGGALMIIAALGRVWAYTYIGGRKNRELCQQGPYSLTRNPLYFFSFLGVCGAALALQSASLTLVAAFTFLVYYQAVIRAEERRLFELFGERFAAYCQAVPRFWPRFGAFRMGETIALSPQLFVRNLSEVFWFLAAILIIEWIEWAKLHALWPTFMIAW